MIIIIYKIKLINLIIKRILIKFKIYFIFKYIYTNSLLFSYIYKIINISSIIKEKAKDLNNLIL